MTTEPAAAARMLGVGSGPAGRTLATYDVVVTDDRDRRICTARVTSMLGDRPEPAPPAGATA
jgi:acyl-coenzyme A thioesterase PaaI-like protein